MRPLPSASDGLGSRSARHGEPSNASAAPSMACFLTTEAGLDAVGDESTPSYHQRPVLQKPNVEPVPRPSRDQPQSARPASLSSAAASSSSSSASSLSSYWPSAAVEQATHHTQPEPLAALLARRSGPESAISTSSSRRNSLTASSFDFQDSSAASIAVLSQGDPPHQDAASDHVPQLIMPSVNVPRRRPFSDAGKSIGKLKVLVAGQAGIGKTSLIRSMAQSCEHIVHLDAIVPSRPGQISEIYASTRAQPWWQTDMDDTHDSLAGERRASKGEVLDRNLCFVDSSTPDGNSTHAFRYIESRLRSRQEFSVDETNLRSPLSSETESLVDVVLYLLPHTGPSTKDLERLRAFQDMTNVIPLLAHADELGSQALSDAKQNMRRAMDHENITYFSFSRPGSSREIYAISSATHTDNDMMDASVLMSSTYTPPLVSTDLSVLVGHIFSLDGSAWLRHSAAVKCARWRRQRVQGGSMPQTALSCRRGMMGGTMSPVLAANPFAQRQSWERVGVSDWARGLRQSLEAERFDQLSLFSTTNSNTLLCESSLALVKKKKQHQKQKRAVQVKGREEQRPVNQHYQDPLGLLELVVQAKCSGKLTVELLSSLGVIGCLAAWLIRPEQACHQDMGWISRWHLAMLLR